VGPRDQADGYRIAARIDQGAVQLLTRSGLNWTVKYPATAAALAKLKVKSAYLDGELCGVSPDGVTSFELIQQASDRGGGGLVYFVFDLLELNGEDLAALPLLDRKTRLAALLEKPPNGVAFSADESSDGEAFRRAACRHGLEGVVSKRVDRRYLPDDRSAWIKCKCLNRGEFVIAGWSDPEGSRPFLGSLLLAYHDDAGRLLTLPRRNWHVVKTLPSFHSPSLAHRRPENAARPFRRAQRNRLGCRPVPLEGALVRPSWSPITHRPGRGRLASPHRLHHLRDDKLL
jgi:ATP-dependent DNA ligase